MVLSSNSSLCGGIMILPTCWEAELANKHPRRCCLHESLDSWTHLQPVYLALRRILHQRRGHASNTDADFTGGRGCERWIASEIYSWTVLPWLLTIPSCILFWIGRTEILQLVFKRSSNQAMKSHPRMIYGSNIGMTTCQVGLVSTFNFCMSQSSVSPAMAAITAIISKPSPLRNGRSMWIMLGYSWPGWPSWGSNWKYWKRRDTI